MREEEIINLIKKLVIGGKKIGEICQESGVYRTWFKNRYFYEAGAQNLE